MFSSELSIHPELVVELSSALAMAVELAKIGRPSSSGRAREIVLVSLAATPRRAASSPQTISPRDIVEASDLS